MRKVLFLLALFLLACSDSGTEPTPSIPSSIALSQSAVTFTALGDSVQINAVVEDQEGNAMSGENVAWASADTSIATVNASGWVFSKGIGSTNVVASSGKLSAKVEVSVEPVYAPSDLKIRIVSGDSQSARVANRIPTDILLLAQAQGVNLLPDPLVVQLVDPKMGIQVMGASIPENMLAGWYVEPQGCGRPFLSTTSFEDDGTSVNYWVRGTRADYHCPMLVGRIVNGQPVIDTIFHTVFEPGPPTYIEAPSKIWRFDGESRSMQISVRDQHLNMLPWTFDLRGPLRLEEGIVVGDGWGVGEFDLIVDSVVVHTGDAVVLPRMEQWGPWEFSLVCEVPDGIYESRWFGTPERWALGQYYGSVTRNELRDMFLQSGVDSTNSAILKFSTKGRYLLLENGDTLYDSATADSTIFGESREDYEGVWDVEFGIGSFVVTADTSALLWPQGEYVEGWYLPQTMTALRTPTMSERRRIDGIPALIPVVGTEPLTWQVEATAACHSNTWTNTTKGTFTVVAKGAPENALEMRK